MIEIEMLSISHIEPVGLMAKDGPDLAKAFCNTYLLQAINEIADQNDKEALHFMGSVAGHALAHMFDNIDIKQIDSVLAQLRSYIIQTKGS